MYLKVLLLKHLKHTRFKTFNC